MKITTYPKSILLAPLIIFYFLTLAPGLTWANNGADGGDLITAAATGGIAHPSGYPTYLLLARLFQLLPVGSLAFRVNLLSVVAAILSTWMAYKIVSATHGWTAGVISAYSLGLSPLFWSQAVIAEVYTLHILFITSFFFFFSIKPRDFILGLTFGLGAGNHLTMIFLSPLLFHKEKRLFFKHLAGAATGLLIYLTLPLRALQNPSINWGNPITLKNFIWLISAQGYQDEIILTSASTVANQIQKTATLFLDQFLLPGVLIGCIGIFAAEKPASLNRGLLWTSTLFFLFPFLYNTRDSYLYLLPAFLCFSIWIGFGFKHLMDAAPRFVPTLVLVFMAAIIFQASNSWRQVDASQDGQAERFGRQMMTQIPKGALVFAKGDRAVFTLWYFHFALHERPDITVIASELLQHHWYQQNIKSTYPRLNLPEFFMFPEVIAAHNPQKTTCRVEFGNSALIQCNAP